LLEEPVDRTIPAAVRNSARRFGDVTAVAEPGGPRLSYRDLHVRTRTVARALIAGGIEPGDRIALWSPNTHHWILAALGTLYAGGTLVPVNTRFTGTEALDVIGRSQARGLFVAGPFLGADRLAMLTAASRQAGATAAADARPVSLPPLIVSVPVEPGGPSAWPARDDGPAVRDWAEFERSAAAVTDSAADDRAVAVGPDDVSDILFTSGTTGRSKGAMSAHRQALDVARAWADCAGLSRADRYLIVNPFFHSFGYKAGLLACLLTGATMIPQRVFDPAESMRLIESERITVLPGAPTIYTTMLEHPDRAVRDLSSLRLAVTGAAVVPVELVERMRAELGFDTVLTAYGLTEAVVVTMCRPGDDHRTVARTSGRATAGFDIMITGTDGTPARAGQAGEVLLRGPNVMLGYLDDPAATAQAISAGGWLHTGDIGTLDARGYLTITDRLKDMYICGGFNVYPAEVEQVLAGHPGVAESVVIGVPDARMGEVGKAFVVPRSGQSPAADDLVAFCRTRLANYKVPRQVELRAELPRNPAGKVLKRLLRQEAP
jgi:acyl-CoA synthetase (AMP-forming)/AMP-acid ligase II